MDRMPVQKLRVGAYIYETTGCSKKKCDCPPISHYNILVGKITKIEDDHINYLPPDRVDVEEFTWQDERYMPMWLVVKDINPNLDGYLHWLLEDQHRPNEIIL
jgi:hypothetical protein